MKVFATRYLEAPSKEEVLKQDDWSWEPDNKEAYHIYASGNSTSSRESTYAAEKDDRADSDRPNEGMFVA
ncbi:hypothetical protein [Paenibacillus piscarius]|uniref:hypothetical protein n=1 Tax=Paenibacillus piscarius TaxID=1089681 RepID=UPI001EE904A3|nr:hypothetical protein [Paenibacillus piscarius]